MVCLEDSLAAAASEGTRRIAPSEHRGPAAWLVAVGHKDTAVRVVVPGNLQAGVRPFRASPVHAAEEASYLNHRAAYLLVAPEGACLQAASLPAAFLLVGAVWEEPCLRGGVRAACEGAVGPWAALLAPQVAACAADQEPQGDPALRVSSVAVA